MKKTLLSAITFGLLSLLLINSSLANLYVKPARLGVVSLEFFPFSPAAVTQNFDVGNRFDFPINVSFSTSGNISDIVSLSKDSLILQPNETQTIDYTITVKEQGTYTGGIGIKVSAPGHQANVAYQADLIVFAHESDIFSSNVFYASIILIIVIVAAVSFYVYKKKGKKK